MEQAFKTALKGCTSAADSSSLQSSDNAKPTCIEDVSSLIENAMSQYQQSRKAKTLKKWLTRLSMRLHFYGNIMDVLAQHHPEYVSLVWGAMKLLIVVRRENIFKAS